MYICTWIQLFNVQSVEFLQANKPITKLNLSVVTKIFFIEACHFHFIYIYFTLTDHNQNFNRADSSKVKARSSPHHNRLGMFLK